MTFGYEANNTYGGKIAEIKKDGFRFDKGPSLLTMPNKIDELFVLANKNQRIILNTRLDESFRYFYEDGTTIKALDQKKLVSEISQKTKVSKKDYFKIFKKNKFIFDSTNHLFLEKSLHKITSYLSFKSFVVV